VERRARYSSCIECVVYRPLRVLNVLCIAFDPLAHILPFLNQFWIAARLVCISCQGVMGSLSVASTVASSTKVTVVDYSEIGRSAVYKRYYTGSRTLP
jgi:hypothetical protein